MQTIRMIYFACLLSFGCAARAAELKDCIEFAQSGSDATLTNICNDTINLMYCVNDPASPRSCVLKSDRVVTLGQNVAERVPGVGSAGKDAIHTALCKYPEAPVGWKPGANVPYVCKKTCVMC